MQALRLPQPTALDVSATRIAATAVALALHVALLGMLLMPPALPSLPTGEETTTVMQWITLPKPVVPPLPPPVVQHRVQPVAPLHAQVPVRSVIEPIASTQASQSQAVTNSIDPIQTDVATNTQTSVVSDPVNSSPPGLHLISGPKPAYPRQSLLAREEGVVTLLVVVNGIGHAEEVSIAKSSGHPLLDRAARAQVLKNWRFEATGIRQSATVDIEFSVK